MTKYGPEPAHLMRPFLVLLFVGSLAASARAEHSPAPGTTRVARWKDDKQAAFTMGFDDSIPNHLTLVIPELRKRRMAATFYLIADSGELKQKKAAWEAVAGTNDGVAVFGDHTMTHRGVAGLEAARQEIGHAGEIIQAMQPGKSPRLMSFAQPGVPAGKWNLTGDEQRQILAEYHLVDRGDFRGHGAMFHQKTADEMVGLADAALAKGGVEYIVFHSVGPGTIPTPEPLFMDFLNKLEGRRDRLWITDHISAYKYETERDSAEVRTDEATPRRLRLSVRSAADPQFFDGALTLITAVPVGWSRCQITQGKNRTVATAANGAVLYEALPGADPILIEPVSAGP